MKFSAKPLALPALVTIVCGLVWAALTSPHDTYDNQVTVENSKALLHMNDHLYDFQSWRPMGHNLLFATLGYLGGEENVSISIHMASVVAYFVSALFLFLAIRLVHGDTVAWLAILILGTLRPLLHWMPVGTSDAFALLPHALALFLLVRPPTRYTPCLLMLCTLAVGSLRPTYLVTIPLMCLAWNPSMKGFRRCVWMAATAGVTYLGIQLLALVALRGREYGWTSFLAANLGQSVWHLKDSVRDPWINAFSMFLWGPGPLVPILGVMGLLWARREAWARASMIPILWLVGVHVLLIRAFELRYLLVLSLPMSWASALVVARAGSWRPLLLALLVLTQSTSLVLETRHHLDAAGRPFLASRVLDIMRDWEPTRNRVFWRGQLFTTLADEAPDVPGDRSWNIISIASASFNLVSSLRVSHFHPHSGMEWGRLSPTQGWIDSVIAKEALDGDIFILSAAKTCYMMKNLPPIMSASEFVRWDPARDADTLIQNPLLLERVRRNRLEPLPGGMWKAGPLTLSGSPDSRLEGCPFTHQAVLLRPGVWDLLWVDRFQAIDRNGMTYLDPEGRLLPPSP